MGRLATGQAGMGNSVTILCLRIVRCGMWILGRDIGCRGILAKQWCDLQLMFDPAVVTLTLQSNSSYVLEVVGCRK